MKSLKVIKIALAVILFSNLCYSQTGWYQVSSGTNKALLSLHFINLNTGFSVGTSGALLVTTNTGNTWQSISLGDTTYSLKKIYFKDQLTGFILGHSPLGVFPTPPLDSLHTRIYKTTDGGINWFVDQPRIVGVFFNSIQFVNSNTGYISGGLYSVGPNKMYKTTNGGNSWYEMPTGVNGTILSMKFTDENSGVIGLMNKIYKTTNGGTTWSKVYENTGNEFNLVFDVNFLNANTGFAAGGYYLDTLNKNRFVLKTTNAGQNWSYLLNDNSGTMINSLTVINEGLIYAAGSVNAYSYQNSGFIIKTINGGSTWNNESIPTALPLADLKSNNLKGFAVGFNGGIYKKDNIVSVTQISTVVPESIKLHQNYPNPFNPATSIKFEINKAGFTQLKVFDITGKEIKNLVEGFKEAGTYEAKFDGVSLNSGIYFYKLMTNGTTITKSMVLVK